MKPGSQDRRQSRKGRRILLRSGARIDEAKVVATTPVAAIPGEIEDHLFVDFTPAPATPAAPT